MQLCRVPGVHAPRPAQCRAHIVPPQLSCHALAAGRINRRHLPTLKAAEEAQTAASEQATQDAEASTVQEASPEPSLSPLERARRLLQDGAADPAELEACLADIDAEMASIRDAATAAESRAGTVESNLAIARDQYLRLNADFDNFRRRTKEENASLKDSIRGDLVKDLLPLVDNFELARTQVKAETEQEQKINNSYQSLYKQMVDIMRSLGVEAVPTVGSKFDPMIHEAIMREPNDEVEDETVLVEFRKGFKIGEKLIRPAMVKVSYREDAPAQPVASSEE